MGLISHLKCCFKRIQEKNIRNFSLRGLSFVCCRLNVYRSALIFINLHCPEKFLVTRLSGNNFDNARITKIKEDFNKSRDRCLNPKIKEIGRILYEIENKKNLSKSKIKEIEQNLIQLEESLFKLNKYYDYNDIEYKGIRDVADLFNGLSTDEDYY